uniref:FLYWCH-type domain-containing protein n=1 Tax=Octopus bimaculoides TaxID=37653 RepID=A0A0L8GV05_OCTBM
MTNFIVLTKNKRKVVESNYIYDFHSNNTKLGKEYWKCEKRKLCSVRIHTVTENNEPKIIYFASEHLHPTDVDWLNARKAVAEIKHEAVENIAASSRSIIAAKFTQLTKNTCSQLSRLPVLSRIIQRYRQKNSGFPANPGARTGFEISGEYYKLDNGEQFLRYDSSIENQQRILVFASENSLQDIAPYRQRACNGMCKTVPEQWFQLFSIYVQVKGSSFPMVFALLPNKTKQIYELHFEQLKLMQLNTYPLDHMADSEVAIH